IIRVVGASGPKRSTNFSGVAARVTTPQFVLWHTNGSESCSVAGKTDNLIKMRSTPRLCSNMGLCCPHCWLNLWKTREWIVNLMLTDNLRCLLASPRGGVAASPGKWCEASLSTPPGWCSLPVDGNTTPSFLEAARWRACASRRKADAARYFLDRSEFAFLK